MPAIRHQRASPAGAHGAQPYVARPGTPAPSPSGSGSASGSASGAPACSCAWDPATAGEHVEVRVRLVLSWYHRAGVAVAREADEACLVNIDLRAGAPRRTPKALNVHRKLSLRLAIVTACRRKKLGVTTADIVAIEDADGHALPLHRPLRCPMEGSDDPVSLFITFNFLCPKDPELEEPEELEGELVQRFETL